MKTKVRAVILLMFLSGAVLYFSPFIEIVQADPTFPAYSDISINSTVPNAVAGFSSYWTDDVPPT